MSDFDRKVCYKCQNDTFYLGEYFDDEKTVMRWICTKCHYRIDSTHWNKEMTVREYVEVLLEQ